MFLKNATVYCYLNDSNPCQEAVVVRDCPKMGARHNYVLIRLPNGKQCYCSIGCVFTSYELCCAYATQQKNKRKIYRKLREIISNKKD